MGQIVDARGLSCPQPVINARKALESHDTIIAIVDNMTAVENVRRMAASLNCMISEEKKPDGMYITISKVSEKKDTAGAGVVTSDIIKPRVLFVSRDVMGGGDDTLGTILIKSFFHTLAEAPPAPDAIIFFNTGVRLVAEGSAVLEDIISLEKSGTRILSCGTCLDYFNLKDRLKAGSITNMYEIKQMMLDGSAAASL